MIRGLMTDWGALFFSGIRGGKQYSNEEQVYVLMKRLHQQYSEIQAMPLKLRDFLFERELEVIMEENKESNG